MMVVRRYFIKLFEFRILYSQIRKLLLQQTLEISYQNFQISYIVKYENFSRNKPWRFSIKIFEFQHKRITGNEIRKV